MGSHQPIRKVVTPEIPDKLYFRIGDVARICEVPAYVLRFWETEFPQLKPNKGGTGQRLYRKRDVEMALRIKSLLYDQGYTIPGARQVFKSEARVKDVAPGTGAETAAALRAQKEAQAQEPRTATGESAAERSRHASLLSLRDQMQSLLAILSAPAGTAPVPTVAAPTSGPRLQAMRPRLVSSGAEGDLAKGSPRPMLRPNLFARHDQPDLFTPPSELVE